MLVLSRQVGTSVKIDGGIKIYVIGVRGNTVRLGFEAPKEVSILRTELAVKTLNGSEINGGLK